MTYIDYSQLIDIYEQVINISGGGASGILNKGAIQGILQQVKNDCYYPNIEDKLTYYFYSFNRNHCFQDGNKRIAIALGIHFLNINGYLYAINRFINETENISIYLAAGKINKELLEEMIFSILYEEDFSEELKIKYYNAISK